MTVEGRPGPSMSTGYLQRLHGFIQALASCVDVHLDVFHAVQTSHFVLQLQVFVSELLRTKRQE